MIMTNHAAVRIRQRAIPPLIVDWLLEFGATKHDKHGAEIKFFDKTSRKKLSKKVGNLIVGALSKQLSTYLVVQNDCVITVGYRTKRIRR